MHTKVRRLLACALLLASSVTAFAQATSPPPPPRGFDYWQPEWMVRELWGPGNMPKGMMMKMPPEFRMLGMDTHKRFDALALEAESIGDQQAVMKQLSGILANCSGCHAAWRLTVAP